MVWNSYNYAVPMAVTIGAIVLGVGSLTIGVSIGERYPIVQTQFATSTVNGKRVLIRERITEPGATRTQYVSEPSPGPGPTITRPGPTVTRTAPGPRATITATAPGPTVTITAPGPTVTIIATISPLIGGMIR